MKKSSNILDINTYYCFFRSRYGVYLQVCEKMTKTNINTTLETQTRWSERIKTVREM